MLRKNALVPIVTLAAAALFAACSSSSPAKGRSTEPTLDQLGKTISRYRDPLVEVIVDYKFANLSVGSDWIILNVAVTSSESKSIEVRRDHVLVRTPDGRKIPLPPYSEFIAAYPERYLGGTEGFGGWQWAELWTHDTAAAAEFYAAVIGYELEQVPVNDTTYSAFRISTERRSGLMQLRDPETAPRWVPYVGVTDLRAILVRVWQAGGEVLFEPAQLNLDIGGENRVALIADPTGAVLFLHQLEEQAVADPLVESQQIRGTSARRVGGESNVDVNVSIGYGFGPGWGAGMPGYPSRPFGPYYPYRY